MTESIHHTSDDVCPLCADKLREAHPLLVDWFNHDIKPKYTDAHISWSWRGRDEQEKAFVEGKTKLHFPDSAHNKMNGLVKYSCALDLFQINNGVAKFAPLWYAKLAQEIEKNKLPLIWGGAWKHLGDQDHFELDHSKINSP